MGRYRKLDHTADLAIEVEAASIEDLFITYAQAMFENIVEGNIKATENIKIELSSDDLKELLLDWLRELLFYFENRGFIPLNIELDIKDNRLTADIKGDKFDSNRHIARIEIKTPTYHQFRLDRNGADWRGLIIFDI